MARTTEELLTEYLKLLPAEYIAATDLLGGIAAQFALIETDGDALFDLATIGGGTGIWLTLQGKGLGVDRSTLELDPSLRERIRNIELRVTPAAVLEAAEALFALDTVFPLMLVEWFESPVLDWEFYLDTHGAALANGPRSFLLLVPELTTDFAEPVYAATLRAINRLRGAGIFWTMVLVPQTSYHDRIPNRLVDFGQPYLEVVGDITTVDNAGFDVFTATDYGVLDMTTLAASALRTWAWRVSWTTAPTHSSPLMGRDQAAGISVWIETNGNVRVVFEAGGVTLVDETVALAFSPIAIGREYWVIFQIDRRALGEVGEIGGYLAVAQVGGAALIASGAWSASGTGTHALGDEQQLGRDTGAGLVTPGAVECDEMIIHEFREYDATNDGFLIDATVALAIADESDPRVRDQAVRYDGSDKVVV